MEFVAGHDVSLLLCLIGDVETEARRGHALVRRTVVAGAGEAAVADVKEHLQELLDTLAVHGRAALVRQVVRREGVRHELGVARSLGRAALECGRIVEVVVLVAVPIAKSSPTRSCGSVRSHQFKVDHIAVNKKQMESVAMAIEAGDIAIETAGVGDVQSIEVTMQNDEVVAHLADALHMKADKTSATTSSAARRHQGHLEVPRAGVEEPPARRSGGSGSAPPECTLPSKNYDASSRHNLRMTDEHRQHRLPAMEE